MAPTHIARVPAGMVVRSLPVNASRMHVEERPGRAPATVWLHHGVGSTRAWDAFIPAAAEGRRVLVYDRRGFGRSSHHRRFSPRIFEEDAADLRVILARLGVGAAHLVGHSDGGTVALLLAARHPELALSVAVVAVHVRGDDVTVGTLREMGAPAGWPAPMRRSLLRSHGDDWNAVAADWHRLWTSPGFAGWSIIDELGAVGCPVLAVHDRHDALSPPLHADTVRERIPEAEVHWVDSGTHYPHRADVAGFSRMLQTFWRRAEGRRRRGGTG